MSTLDGFRQDCIDVEILAQAIRVPMGKRKVVDSPKCRMSTREVKKEVFQ